MNLRNFSAGTSRFAHLAGLSRRGRRAAEDDRDDNDQQGKRGSRADDDDDLDDDDQAKGKRSRRAADDDDRDDDDQPKGKRSRRAADDDDDERDDDDQPKGKRSRRAADDDDRDDDDQPKGKRSRRAADDDDDDDADDDKDEMSGRSARASARRREQARIATILSHPMAANNLDLAISLACETRMTRQEAIRVMKGQQGKRRPVDDDDEDYRAERGNRHARSDRASRNANLGSDTAAPTGSRAIKSSWDAAFAKAGVKTR